jgi:hypothetical protein
MWNPYAEFASQLVALLPVASSNEPFRMLSKYPGVDVGVRVIVSERVSDGDRVLDAVRVDERVRVLDGVNVLVAVRVVLGDRVMVLVRVLDGVRVFVGLRVIDGVRVDDAVIVGKSTLPTLPVINEVNALTLA